MWRLQAFAWLATAVVFLWWLHRAYTNLAWRRGAGLGYTPRWAVGAFFVPVLNLFHPSRVLRDLWRGGAVRGAQLGAPEGRGLPVWAWLWWPLLLLALAVDPVPIRPFEGAARRLDLGTGLWRLLIAGLSEIAAAVLAIVTVIRVTRGLDSAEGG